MSYRNLILGVEYALSSVGRARQERATQRGAAFLRNHFTEAISIKDAARAAGFAPDHFTRLFRRQEGTTPEAYLGNLRLEKAKRMLAETELGMEAVRVLSGYRSRTYFHHAFNRAEQMTPQAFRRKHRGPPPKRRAPRRV